MQKQVWDMTFAVEMCTHDVQLPDTGDSGGQNHDWIKGGIKQIYKGQYIRWNSLGAAISSKSKLLIPRSWEDRREGIYVCIVYETYLVSYT